MSALKLSGIEIDAVVAAAKDIKQSTRNIGEQSPASDGTMHQTRSARKLDFAFQTVPLALSAAAAWWAFFSGEGEAWSFDAHLYGSKGTGPSSTSGTVFQSAGSAKFGAGKLSLTNSASITWAGAAKNSFSRSDTWTVSLWRNAGSWSHYVVNSAGQKWVDGVRNDAATTTFLSVSSGDVTLSNSAGTVTFDDLVVVPYLMPTDWPAQLAAAAAAFGPLPAHLLTGDFVTEQSSRLVLGSAKESQYQKVAGGVVLVTFDVELQAR